MATACPDCPGQSELESWALAALQSPRGDEELTIRIVDAEESQQLNAEYRGQHKPTNVLSFASDLPPDVEVNLLGDLVICAPVVIREAEQQNKPLRAHWAHMVVHGLLHLQGFDHIDDRDAEIMEQLERRLLAQLGFNDPYAS